MQEKLRKENDQAQIDADERQQAAADRIDRLRSKLRDAQEELKKCRAELEKAQERPAKMSSVSTTTVPVKGIAAKGIAAKTNAKKKRAADEMSADDKVLLTPGTTDDRPKRPLKKRGFDLSMVGGKSEFSITPFLNKTVNLDASPNPPGEDATPSAPFQFRGVEDEPTTTALSSASKPTAKLVEKRPRGRPRMKPLTDAAPSKKNLTVRTRKLPRVAESTLEKVAEEQEPDDSHADSSANLDQENRSSAVASVGKTVAAALASTIITTTTTSANSSAVGAEKPEPKKKKRKLLGGANPAAATTLFEGGEDEGERVKPAAAVSAAAAAGAVVGTAAAVKRPAVKVGGGVGGGAKAGRVGGVKNAFAAAGGASC
jgi:hypothetical protein